MILKKPELISPAGDIISLRSAINAGADAIFFGVNNLNMRANAKNFSLSDIKKITTLCHKNKVKAYITLNTIIYDEEIKKAEKIIKKAKLENVDAVICSDFAIINLCKKHKLPFHISTQKSISNFESLKVHSKLGAKMAVLARELSLKQIKIIIKQIHKHNLKIKIETFIHGAMCVSVSGRCFISQFQFGRSANRGDCLQPCRRNYHAFDPEEKYQLDINNNFILSPKDLCTIEIIDKLIEAKISAFKIEGRNRSPEYVKVTTRCYREAIDYYFKNKGKTGFKKDFEALKKQLKEKITSVYNRGFSTGFFLGKPINEWTDSYGSKATQKKIFIGPVLNYFNKPQVAEIKIQTNSINQGDFMMIQGPTTGIIEQKVNTFLLNDKESTSAKKGQTITIKLPKTRKNDKVYIMKNRSNS